MTKEKKTKKSEWLFRIEDTSALAEVWVTTGYYLQRLHFKIKSTTLYLVL